MNQDPHAVLGVPRGVSAAALKRAFRARARETHPDHGGDRVAFEAVVAAFEALRPAAVPAPAVARSTPAGRAYATVRPPAHRFCAYDSAVPVRPGGAGRARRPSGSFADVLAAAMAAAA